jgi:uncharacterized membrane protein
MAVLIVLFASWAIFRGLGALGVDALSTWRHSAVYALAVMFVFTAVAHFNKMKHDLARMIPSIFPQPMLLIHITGVLEFLGALGLLLSRFRRMAGICLAIMLVGLFVTNVNAARTGVTLRGKPATNLWLRTPMQIFFIWLLLWSTKP